MASRAPRVSAVDLSDDDAKRILSEHVLAANTDARTLFQYRKKSPSQGPHWQDLWASRHLLGDLVAATRGQLLRQRNWERQLHSFLVSAGVEGAFSEDELALVARRPRLMLSHLWNLKRNGGSTPQKYQQLGSLVQAMNTRERKTHEEAHTQDDLLYDDSGEEADEQGDVSVVAGG